MAVQWNQVFQFRQIRGVFEGFLQLNEVCIAALQLASFAVTGVRHA
jgi:hypothetical protein